MCIFLSKKESYDCQIIHDEYNGKTNTFNRDFLDSGLYFIQLFQNNQLIATKKLLIKVNIFKKEF